jgi:hypothetical protein
MGGQKMICDNGVVREATDEELAMFDRAVDPKEVLTAEEIAAILLGET